MIFPTNDQDLHKVVKRLVDTCTDSRFDRDQVYKKRESYFLFGTDSRQPVKYNRLESHLDLVASFLYAPDHAFYHIAAERNSKDVVVRQAVALQDEWNDDYQDSGLSDLFADAIPWSLCYDSMILKLGWNEARGEIFGTLIPPQNFGVYREDISDLDAQQCFCHTYFLDWHESVMRLMRAGKTSEIARIGVTDKPFVSPYPDMFNRMIISATSGSNLQGNVIGQVNPLYNPQATYQPQVNVPTVQWNELWAWDDRYQDYRIFHMVQPDIVIGDSLQYCDALWGIESKRKKMTVPKAIVGRRRGGENPFDLFPEDDQDEDVHRSRCNLFLPREHPFTMIQPYPKYNYFWGIAHVDRLMSLQDWTTERLEQIADLLEKQAYPPRVGSGFMGLADEKMEAFGGADTWLMDQLPQAQVKELHPEMPPSIFEDFHEIGGLFMEASGLTELIAGRGETGVRSGKQERGQKQTGGARIKKAAIKLEASLARIGDVGLRLKMKNDDDKITPESGEEGGKDDAVPFAPAQIASEVKIRIDGHSHSPLFSDESREIAQILKRAQAIDNEMFVRMLNPPGKDNIIHSMRIAKKREAQLMKQHPELLEKMMGGKQKGGKK